MIAIPRENRRLAIGAAASLAAHAGVGAAIFLGFATAEPASPPPAAMVVELAPLPSAPPVPPSLAPPTPEQKEATPKPAPPQLKIPPLPKLVADVKPEVAVPAKEEERPDKTREQDDKPAEVTTHQAAPEAPRKDASKAPAIGAPSDKPSTAEQNWEGRVLAALERRKRYPAEAQRGGQEDLVYVRIMIDRRGRVTRSEIRRSRRYPLLDAEVLALVRRASPLPVPPKEVPGETIDMVVPVEFFIKSRR